MRQLNSRTKLSQPCFNQSAQMFYMGSIHRLKIDISFVQIFVEIKTLIFIKVLVVVNAYIEGKLQEH